MAGYSEARAFPFSAVCGMDDAKRALSCMAANPSVRTVLIRGPSGTAKTVLCRSFGAVWGREVVNIPLNVTEEQLFGGMDIDATVREGRAVLEPGLLSRADGRMLYADDVNLLDRRVLASLLDCVLSGKVVVEREGVSAEYPLDTVLVATMNPSRSDLSPHILDRFDLCASVPGTGPEERREVLRRNMAFQEDPAGFSSSFSEEDGRLSEALSSAAVSGVEVTDGLLAVVSGVSGSLGCEGMRGEISLVAAAVALAALDGRTSVSEGDVSQAARIALVHRARRMPDAGDYERVEGESGYGDGGEDAVGGKASEADAPVTAAEGRIPSDPGERRMLREIVSEVVFSIGEEFRVIDLFDPGLGRVRRTSSRKGGRAMVESSDGTGRYARSRLPSGDVSDVAFDATVRAAAPYQRGRDRGDLALAVEEQDIRVKVRERRAGCTILFVVDSSGSQGINDRMSAVKGAILSMLRESYVKRDRIGMMVFRQSSAELVLPPTRSVEYTYRMLADIPTGGRTPLGRALIAARDYMEAYAGRHPGEDCHVVLITDGIGNVPVMPGSDPTREVLSIARGIYIPDVRWIVIDTSSGLTIKHHAEELAEALGAKHLRIRDLDADRLAEGVRSAVAEAGRNPPP